MIWHINEYLLEFLNSLGKYKIISVGVGIFADGPIFIIPIFLIGMRLFAVKKDNIEKKVSLMHIFYGCVIGIILSITIQHFIHIQRPEEHLKGIGNLLLKHIPNASFPSDHATVAFAFLSGLYFFKFNKYFWYFLPLMVLMVVSRIIAGVHWPYDILCGCGIGIASGYISYKFLQKNKFVKKVNLLIIKLLSVIKL